MQATLPRTCPRCRGSMIVERDWYRSYSTCLCCGYVHEGGSPPPLAPRGRRGGGARMHYARLSLLAALEGEEAEARLVEEELLAVLAQQPGFVDGYFLS